MTQDSPQPTAHDILPIVTVDKLKRSQQYTQSLKELLALANEQTVPTGILHMSPFTLDSMHKFNGTDQHFTIKPREWEQHYHDLQRGVIKGLKPAKALPTLTELKEQAKTYASRMTTPIVITNLLHNHPNSQFIHEVKKAAAEDRAISIPTNPQSILEERRGFFASVLLPDKFDNFTLLPLLHEGLNVRFVLDEQFYITNDPEPPLSIEIDFADGQGFRQVYFGDIIEVAYQEEGDKYIELRVHYPHQLRKAKFVFRVKNIADVPLPDLKWDIQATIPYKNELGSGPAYILYGSENGIKHTKLVNPILIADGFPGHPYEDIYQLLNTEGFLKDVLAGGYDVVLLSYTNGSDYIQRNAFVAIACVEKIIQNRVGTKKLLVGGGSMGGIITRYALAYMEQNGMDHQTAIYLSLDSPHQGAHIPPSIQFFVRVLAELLHNHAAEALDKLLQSPAAQQFLIYNVYFDKLSSPLHQEFYQELKNLGLPRIPTTIAVANGSGDGQHIIPDYAHTIHWHGNVCANGDTWALGQSNEQTKIASIYLGPYSDYHMYVLSVQNTLNYDGAPGGQRASNGEMAQELQDSGYGQVEHWYDNTCFIPTASALNINTLFPYPDPWKEIPSEGANSPFNLYFLSPKNSGHVVITPEIKLFLLTQLGLTKFAGPLSTFPDEGTSLHIFGVTSTRSVLSVLWVWWDGSSYSLSYVDQTDLGGGLSEQPGSLCAINGPDTFNIFAISTQGHLLHTSYLGYPGPIYWSDWKDLGSTDLGGGLEGGAPLSGMVEIEKHLTHVFAVSRKGHLLHKIENISQSSDWEDFGVADLGGGLGSALSVLSGYGASAPYNPIEVFAVSIESHLLYKNWNGSQWSSWEDLGVADLAGGLSNTAGSLVAVKYPTRPIDIFAISTQGHLLRKQWGGSQWLAWEDLGVAKAPAELGGPLSAVANYKPPTDVLAISAQGHLLRKSWSGSQWLDWTTVF